MAKIETDYERPPLKIGRINEMVGLKDFQARNLLRDFGRIINGVVERQGSTVRSNNCLRMPLARDLKLLLLQQFAHNSKAAKNSLQIFA